MKRGISLVLGSVALSVLIFFLAACQKANNTHPQIILYKTSLYLATDTTLKAGTTFSVYLTASKSGVDQILKTATISHSINGGPDSVIQSMSLDKQYLSQFYSYIVHDSGTVEKFTFAVTQTNELSADTSISITVN